MTLTPAVAAQIASAAYGIRTQPNVEQGVREAAGELLANSDFDFGAARSVTGSSGAGRRSSTGFTMVVPYRKDELIVATRGTVTGYDWISDFCAAMEPGPMGCAVHAGFNRVAKSVWQEVKSLMPNKNPTKIHVVGHSLGGAVSNILAVQLAMAGNGVELYTFGAPRPGLDPFRDLLAYKVGEQNMYRAFSMSDPVPMVPIHPFLHAPRVQPGALCGSRHGIVNPFAHKMGAYKEALGEKVAWKDLMLAAHVTPMNIEELLTLASKQITMPGVSGGLYLLGRILAKLLNASNESIGGTVTGGLTVLDQVGLALFRQRVANPEIQENLTGFMKYAMILAGLPFKVGSIITAAYITHVLTILLRTVVGQANTAIARRDQDA